MYKALIIITLFLTACTGPVGPQGEKGPKGEEGEIGKDGVCSIKVSILEGQLTGKNSDLWDIVFPDSIDFTFIQCWTREDDDPNRLWFEPVFMRSDERVRIMRGERAQPGFFYRIILYYL